MKGITEKKQEEIRQGLRRFKMGMMRHMPFYGDILMKIQVIEDDTIPTACTNGKCIRYNPVFFAKLNEGERNYVFMHEVLHILLLHWKRKGERHPKLWNVACDYMVNGQLDRMALEIHTYKMQFERPKVGCFLQRSFYYDETTEGFYNELCEENKKWGSITYQRKRVLHVPADLIICEDQENGESLSPEEAEAVERSIRELIRDTIKRRGRSARGHGILKEIMELGIVETKKLPWHKLLSEYLQEREDEESSYMTPERKYIHMDLIIPGCGKTEDELGEIWTFIDSSGSVTVDELSQFLTQLCRISSQFHCKFHIAFWDTQVSDVYRNVQGTGQILKCVPHSSGGTDINCVYDYLKENRIKPEVMLILTDGYYGELKEPAGSLTKRTILVISDKGKEMDRDNGVGKLAKL